VLKERQMCEGESETPEAEQAGFLDLVLRQMNDEGGFKASVLVSSEGLPITSVSSPFDIEMMAAMVTLVGNTVEQARKSIGLDELDEVSLVQADRTRLICRRFSVSKEQVILATIAPPDRTYRRLTNRAIKRIRSAWEPWPDR
jgi:predicted regulator of Ras-like GTPase activity (Roadblock/LC7/MglB family)